MKKFGLVGVLALAAFTFNANANVSGYGHVHLSHLEPAQDASVWLRASQVVPMYPRELAQEGIVGCGVFKVVVNENGETDSIDLVRSVPERGIERPVANIIRKWEWQNVSGEANVAEEKLIRLDFVWVPRHSGRS